jgi:hypothetical protein
MALPVDMVEASAGKVRHISLPTFRYPHSDCLFLFKVTAVPNRGTRVVDMQAMGSSPAAMGGSQVEEEDTAIKYGCQDCIFNYILTPFISFSRRIKIPANLSLIYLFTLHMFYVI